MKDLDDAIDFVAKRRASDCRHSAVTPVKEKGWEDWYTCCHCGMHLLIAPSSFFHPEPENVQ